MYVLRVIITRQHLNVYSYKLKNNIVKFPGFFFFTFMRQKKMADKSLCGRWIFKSTCHSGRWPKKLTSGPGRVA